MMPDGEQAFIGEQADYATMHRRVIAAVNRNDAAWLLWALGIPVDVRRSDLVATVRRILQEGRNKAAEVLLDSPIEPLRRDLVQRELVAPLLFDFGPAIIMMMSSTETRPL